MLQTIENICTLNCVFDRVQYTTVTVNKKQELENYDFSQLWNSIHLIPSANDAYGMPGCPRKMFLQNIKFCVWESRKGEVLNVWKPVNLQVLELRKLYVFSYWIQKRSCVYGSFK